MQKKNWFVRVLVILLILFIASIIVTSYCFSSNRFIITGQIICLICILVILALAEIFDNFSIGNLITLSRQYKHKEKELERSEKENRELRLQLTNIFSNINANHNTNIFGSSPELLSRLLGVEKAEPEEVEKKIEEEVKEHTPEKHDENEVQTKMDYMSRRRVFQGIENLLLTRYFENNNIKQEQICRQIKFSEGFVDTDPIMERNVIFDAYYKEPWDEEVFVEMCMSYSSPSMLDRFYHLLSKVYHYRTVKKLRAKLVLIVPEISETNAVDLSLGGRETSKERFFKYFAPAIKNNLLEIVELDVSDADIEKIKKEI